MESTRSNNRPLLIAILVIVSIILILTAVTFSFFLIAVLAELQTGESEPIGAEALPEDLATEEHRAQLFAEFKLNYNSGDNERLLSMFGKAYQLQVTQQEFDKSMETIRKMASIIDDGEYSHYEFERLGSGLTKFHLWYDIRSPEGWRELKVSVTQQGDDPYAIFAFKINTPA